ncbi:sce7726 family protein [Lysinibacillus fusiformis]|uniref:sce7726 family protein n=1 Tax=Lysinibacillus fusiformis TaxID=28031 RepID=UPI003D0644C9
MKKLKDQDIRDILDRKLNLKHRGEDVRIVHELGVLHGQSRVDIAVVNGILHGYEIKSESDNLLRLPNQIIDYNKVFDRMTIVVQRKYLAEVKEIIPKWWGILLVTTYKGENHLREIRKGRLNPNVDSLSLSMLLWKNEALQCLKDRGLQKGYLSKPREVLYQHISDSLPLPEIKEIVNHKLKTRDNWRVY